MYTVEVSETTVVSHINTKFFIMMYVDIKGKKRFNIPRMESLLKDPDIIKVLSILKHENLSDLVDGEGTTLLHLCAKYNSHLLLMYLIRDKLLDINFYINAVNSFNETPLMTLVQNNYDISTWKFFLNCGADLWKMKNNSGHSALAIIIRKYRLNIISKFVMTELEKNCCNILEIVDVLLDAGCQLYHLELFKKAEITKLMLERGSLVNLQNPEDADNTTLHITAGNNDVDNVKVLLEFGADQYIKNKHQILPIQKVLSSDSPNLEMLSLLWPNDKDWILQNIDMAKIFRECKEEVFKLILQLCKFNINAVDENNRTPLHYLAGNCNTSSRHFWESLKNTTIEVDAKDRHGLTPLCMAIGADHLEAIRFFLAKGADVNSLNNEGQSPLFWLNAYYGIGNLDDCFKFLIENGANAQLVDHRGRTIISVLRENHRNEEVLITVLHYFAITEARGSIINRTVLNHIEADTYINSCYTKYKQEVDEMKTKKISGKVTYFDFLVDEDQKIRRYVKNEEMVKELSIFETKNDFDRLVKKRFKKAMEINHWRTIAGQLISECITPFAVHWIIIEKILDYLDASDLKLIAITN